MIKNILRELMLILTLASLAACNEVVTVGDGYGRIGLNLGWDTSLATKADGDAVEVGDDTQVTVSVCDMDGNPVAGPTTYVYSALKEAEFEVPVGRYTVKASTGSNHQAAWDSPFYYGEDEVTVYAERDNQAEVICTLANVKVTVSFDERFAQYCTSYSVTVDNGAGEGLTFGSRNGKLDAEGYFAVTGTLNWNLVLINNDGKSYVASGTIDGVEAQQHYPLSFSLSEIVEDETGASVFKVTVDDSINEKEFDAVLDFSESGDYEVTVSGFEYVAGGIAVPMGDQNVKTITTSMTNGISAAFVCVNGVWYELSNADQGTIDRLSALGIDAASVAYGASSFTVDVTDYLASIGDFGFYPVIVSAYDVKGLKAETRFDFEIISNVDASAVSAEPSAYSAVITAKWYANEIPDGLGLEYKPVSSADWTSVDASAISYDAAQKKFSAEITGLAAGTQYSFRPYSAKDRDNIKTMEFYTNFTAPVSAKPWAKFAVVTGKWLTDTEPEGLTFKYREYGTTGWIEADPATVRLSVDITDKTFTGDITGLNPKSTYEFRAVSKLDADTNLQMGEFTTAGMSTLYNLNFDDWCEVSSVWYPYSSDAADPTWDTANGGVKLLKETLTTPEYDFKVDKSGNKASARLESKALTMFAAGNIYTGKFIKAKVIGGVGAELDWGVPFTSKPVALRGYYSYSPAPISVVGNGANVSKGDPDRCQIQIFLTDWEGDNAPFRINTATGKFVEMDADYIIAAGMKESAEDNNGRWEKFTIPVEYRDDRTPTYIVVAAASSYLGDYFTGGDGSTLFVDEFELIYDIGDLTDEEAAKVNYR
ncbi:MAG: DUF4493 domain-containing protein [Bacteroidales bacterium]|nr:DUF4493 domain-containing protein [Bacteroidales bacterium]